MSDETPVVMAAAAAEAVRRLNHVTSWAPYGYEWPSDVDSVMVEFGSMARRLPQALAQAAAYLMREERAGRVGTDDDREALSAVLEVGGEVDVAIGAAEAFARSVERVRALTSHLTGIEPSAGHAGGDQ